MMASYDEMINYQMAGLGMPERLGWGGIGGIDLGAGNSAYNSIYNFGNSLPELFKSTQGPNGLSGPSAFQGYLGNAQSVFDLLGAGAGIMGGMKYGKYVDTQRKALDQQIKTARAQRSGYYENQGARRGANAGMSQADALAYGRTVSDEQMKRWGL